MNTVIKMLINYDIEKLNKEGYELHEVPARKFVTMKNPLGLYSKKLLLKWYKKHGLEFKSIVFCSEKNTGVEKTNACLNLNIKIMVEDRPEIAVKLAEKKQKDIAHQYHWIGQQMIV